MKILLFDAGSYTYRDILTAFTKMGHSCRTVFYHFPDRYEDVFFEERLTEYLAEHTYDRVFSVNFFPLVAKVCDRCHIRYLSWSYDSPLEERLQDFFQYETNRIFLLTAWKRKNTGRRDFKMCTIFPWRLIQTGWIGYWQGKIHRKNSVAGFLLWGRFMIPL